MYNGEVVDTEKTTDYACHEVCKACYEKIEGGE
jgi:hypothetical protein